MTVHPLGAPSIAGLAARLGRVATIAVRGARRYPATLAYTVVLGVVTVVLTQLDGTTRDSLIRAASTNLANLGTGHLSTLITSAFVTTEPPSAPWWIALVTVMAWLELRWGSWRAVGVFAAGHIGATVLIAVGLAIAVVQGWAGPEVLHTVDVGISYGVMALLGAITAELPPAGRPVWVVTWTLAVVASVVTTSDFTSIGHLCAMGIGLGIAAAQLQGRRNAGRALSGGGR